MERQIYKNMESKMASQMSSDLMKLPCTLAHDLSIQASSAAFSTRSPAEGIPNPAILPRYLNGSCGN